MIDIPTVLILALITIESGGEDDAVGDYRFGIPYSYGCLQIQRGVIIDVNKIVGYEKYTHAHAFNRKYAIEICRIYLGHYCSPEVMGKPITWQPFWETMARVWNKGPKGYDNPKSLAYWVKVERVLLAQQTGTQGAMLNRVMSYSEFLKKKDIHKHYLDTMAMMQSSHTGRTPKGRRILNGGEIK